MDYLDQCIFFTPHQFISLAKALISSFVSFFNPRHRQTQLPSSSQQPSWLWPGPFCSSWSSPAFLYVLRAYLTPLDLWLAPTMKPLLAVSAKFMKLFMMELRVFCEPSIQFVLGLLLSSQSWCLCWFLGELNGTSPGGCSQPCPLCWGRALPFVSSCVILLRL
jgi:hypothetical protein